MRTEGLGFPPPELTWDLKDEEGNAVSKGEYRYVLHAWDNCLKKAETQPQTVHVMRGIEEEIYLERPIPFGTIYIVVFLLVILIAVSIIGVFVYRKKRKGKLKKASKEVDKK